MGSLNGRVAIVTGAGRGLGREHALLLAAEGASVVVNDRGVAADGSGTDALPADEVVSEIAGAGGRAVANSDDVSDWNGAKRLIEQAIAEFGALHVLVNNAGILRDRSIVSLDEQEFDDVVRVHLRGHVATTHWAAEYWRDASKRGETLSPCLINTTSVSGLIGNFSQAAYGSAKAGIAALTVIAQIELGRYGVRANAIAPAARTRLTANSQVITGEGEGFDRWDPANVSPLVAYLARADCPMEGKVFFAAGGDIVLMRPWTAAERAHKDGRWAVEELRGALAGIEKIDTRPEMPE
jgi:NAD(P)-dependent dehydrogenase (short-subunit alcohol dehydrogenase family)